MKKFKNYANRYYFTSLHDHKDQQGHLHMPKLVKVDKSSLYLYVNIDGLKGHPVTHFNVIG